MAKAHGNRGPTSLSPGAAANLRRVSPTASPDEHPPLRGAPLWLALQLPALALEALLRADGHEGALAVLDIGDGRARVIACTEAAARAGVRAHLSHTAALALCPSLRTLVREPDAEARALEGLAAWAGQFTSRVSLQPPAGLLLEIGASLGLFGGLHTLLGRIATGLEALGYHWRRGVAPTPTAAWLLASAGIDTPVCSLATLPAALAPIPVDCLPLTAKCRQSLVGLGVRCFGDCARLPRDGLTQRLGAALPGLIDRALGRRPDPRDNYRPPLVFERAIGLPVEVVALDMLLHAAGKLLLELAGLLCALGAGVQRLEVRFVHRGAPPSRVRIGLLQPTRDVTHLLSLLRERLNMLALPAPVVQLELSAPELLPLAPSELTLFADSARPAETLQPLLERLRMRLGEDAVQGLAVVTAYRPERAWRPCEPGTRSLAVRLPARPVWLLEEPEPLPLEHGQPACGGPLRAFDGPERIESGWWDGADVARDYYTAENPRGQRFWIFRDLRQPLAWYLHGVFG